MPRLQLQRLQRYVRVRIIAMRAREKHSPRRRRNQHMVPANRRSGTQRAVMRNLVRTACTAPRQLRPCPRQAREAPLPCYAACVIGEPRRAWTCAGGCHCVFVCLYVLESLVHTGGMVKWRSCRFRHCRFHHIPTKALTTLHGAAGHRAPRRTPQPPMPACPSHAKDERISRPTASSQPSGQRPENAATTQHARHRPGAPAPRGNAPVHAALARAAR